MRSSSSSSFGKPSPVRMAMPDNICTLLTHRQITSREINLSTFSRHRIDETYQDVASHVYDLRDAIRNASVNTYSEIGNDALSEIVNCLSRCFVHLFDDMSAEAINQPIKPAKQQECETFVALGGMDVILELFNKPFAEPDARLMGTWSNTRLQLWGEVLFFLRELCYSVPSLANNVFGLHHIAFVFTMLSQQQLFDVAASLLEEVLSTRVDTFPLDSVPDLYKLLDSMSVRELAHFCRVLSLLLFESEDRQIMEGSHVLRSTELLQLRRDRMGRPFAFSVVERNQSLIIGAPNILRRLVMILRVVQYGPDLAESIRHNVVTQNLNPNLSAAIEMSLGSGRRHENVWTQLASLHATASNAKCDDDRPPQSRRRAGSSTAVAPEDDEASATSQLSQALASLPVLAALVGGGEFDAAVTPDNMDLSHLLNEMMQTHPYTDVHAGTHSQGITTSAVSSNSAAVAAASSLPGPSPSSGGDHMQSDSVTSSSSNSSSADLAALAEEPNGAQAGGSQEAESQQVMTQLLQVFSGEADAGQILMLMHTLGFYRSGTSPRVARHKLQFMSMLLVPHQVEVLFVLCTLLSGRRKIFTQDLLSKLGLGLALTDLFEKMSWDSPPFNGPNPLEHIHGPNCECNPESALRVQYLRLVHNFYDRDFTGNRNKFNLLTVGERERVREPLSLWAEKLVVPASDHGLISKIAQRMQVESFDSIYRFWLSSCLEAFVRGTNPHVQLFVARQGVLQSIVSESASIRGLQPATVSANHTTVSNLQTSLDLLGELIKDSESAVSLLDLSLSASSSDSESKNDAEFLKFMNRLLRNIIDSNVFLRAAYLTLHTVNAEYVHLPDQYNSIPSAAADPVFALRDCTVGAGQKYGYLTHTWMQFAPKAQPQESAQNANLPSKVTTHSAPIVNESAYAGDSGSDQSKSSSPRVLSKYDPPSPSPALFSTRGHAVVYSELNNNPTAVRRHPTPATALSDTTSMLVGRVSNAIAGLQSAAAQFSQSFVPDRRAQREAQALDRVALTRASSGTKTVRPDDDELEFVTPPEYPLYGKSSSAVPSGSHSSGPASMNTREFDWAGVPIGLPPRSPKCGQSLGTMLSTIPEPGPSATASPVPTDEGQLHSQLEVDKPSSRTPYEWRLPAGLVHLHRFLMRKEPVILLQLITCITARSISHENICCINTALLLLLLAEQRGELLRLLTDLRALSALGPHGLASALEGDVSAHDIMTAYPTGVEVNADEHMDEADDDESDESDRLLSADWQVNSSTSDQGTSIRSGVCTCIQCGPAQMTPGTGTAALCGFVTTPNSAPSTTVSELAVSPVVARRHIRQVMRNFRELLWFWQEYYLRRGRDRLSVEFSTHIPFRQWQLLVSRLCADDGSQLSLLPRPITMPLSPYVIPPRSHCHQPNEVVNYRL